MKKKTTTKKTAKSMTLTELKKVRGAGGRLDCIGNGAEYDTKHEVQIKNPSKR